MSNFAQPIIDLLADHSRWSVTLIAGGPQPADAGRLHMVRCALLRFSACLPDDSLKYSVHSGATSGAVQMNFGRSERVAYKEVVIPLFSRFLRKCYCKYIFMFILRMPFV